MEIKKLYALSALFNDPNAIIKVTKKIVELGFKDFDVHSPYPLHGINKAMNLKSSKVGFISLFGGLTGVSIALSFILYVTQVDYPLIIGGKPFFAWPAFVPVIFEVTVLFTAIITVLGMLFILFKFPNNSHPLHDTDYMKKVSSDHFGIVVKAEDKCFDENILRNELLCFNPVKIENIYFTEDEVNSSAKMFNSKFISFLFVEFIVVSLITFFILNYLVYTEPFTWMMQQEKIKPQTTTTFFHDGISMRKPVNGTISKGEVLYDKTGPVEKNSNFLPNPLTFNNDVLELGKKKYNTFCSPCHDYLGNGNSRLRGQFPNPPTLHSDKLRQWEDGKLFHVITAGQNIMPSYSTQLSVNERWAITNYIRLLQRAGNAKEGDLK